MGPDVAALAAILAAAGRPEAQTRLAEVAGGDGDRTTRAIEVLADGGVVVSASGVVRFSHDLMRAAVATDAATDTGREIHARWAALQEGAALENEDVATREHSSTG